MKAIEQEIRQHLDQCSIDDWKLFIEEFESDTLNPTLLYCYDIYHELISIILHNYKAVYKAFRAEINFLITPYFTFESARSIALFLIKDRFAINLKIKSCVNF